MVEKEALVTIKVEIEPEGMKRLIKQGKLVAFVDTLPVMLAGNIKAQLVEELAASAGLGGSSSVVFEIDDFGPWPGPWPGPWADVGIPLATMLSYRK